LIKVYSLEISGSSKKGWKGRIIKERKKDEDDVGKIIPFAQSEVLTEQHILGILGQGLNYIEKRCGQIISVVQDIMNAGDADSVIGEEMMVRRKYLVVVRERPT